jgi:predicted DNA binding CopG/RHH family protein
MKITKEMEEQFEKDADAAIKEKRSAVKVRITAMIDLDVIDALKKHSHQTGIKYQTLLNMKLRESVLGEAIIDKKQLASLKERIQRLEDKVMGAASSPNKRAKNSKRTKLTEPQR